MLAPRNATDAAAETVAAIAEFLGGASLEATRPNAEDVAALKAALPAGTPVYLSAVLTRPGFSEAEIKVLRGVLASLDYFSPKEPRGAGYPARKVQADEKAHGEGSAAKQRTPKA